MDVFLEKRSTGSRIHHHRSHDVIGQGLRAKSIKQSSEDKPGLSSSNQVCYKQRKNNYLRVTGKRTRAVWRAWRESVLSHVDTCNVPANSHLQMDGLGWNGAGYLPCAMLSTARDCQGNRC